MENIEALKYPIGKFDYPLQFDALVAHESVKMLSEFPARLIALVEDLNEQQLQTPYRAGGWTVKQTIHHIADSHMNAYIRFKLTLTEDMPTIKPYAEAPWAELNDSKITDVAVSLTLLDAVHQRWVNVMQGMGDDDFNRKYFHPDYKKEFTLWGALALYDWHANHHYAHIANLIKRNNW